MSIGNLLDAVKTAEEYRTANLRLFPSAGSLEWFIRQHKEELLKAGALLIIRGRLHIHANRFDAALLELGERAALKSAA